MAPDEPSDEAPVLKSIPPLTPFAPAFADLSVNAPLELRVP